MTIAGPSEEKVQQIAKDLAPDVVHVRFEIGRDWSDHPGAYFRVILSDDASRRERLSEVTGRVKARFNELGLLESGLIPYFRFRSVSEQATLRERSWD